MTYKGWKAQRRYRGRRNIKLKGEDMKVWKVTEGDGGRPLYIERMAVWDEVQGGLEYDEVGNKYAIEVVDMAEETFYNLPEWDGF